MLSTRQNPSVSSVSTTLRAAFISGVRRRRDPVECRAPDTLHLFRLPPAFSGSRSGRVLWLELEPSLNIADQNHIAGNGSAYQGELLFVAGPVKPENTISFEVG